MVVEERTSSRLRLLAAGAAVSAWALVAVGGVVRVTESGLGCPHWPLCTDRAVPLDQRASVIEYSHRAVVALVVVLVVAVAVVVWRTQRSRRDLLWPALAAAALVPGQALLGAVAVWLELPGWVVAFHFVVGLVFLAAVVATAVAAWRRPGRPSVTPLFAGLARLGVAVGLVLVSVGAAVVATDSDTACGTQWPACNGGFAAGGGHAELQVAHRMLAYALAAIAIGILVLALRGRGPRLAGLLPAVAVLVQIGLGVSIVLVGGDGVGHEILSGAHEAGAGLVWALLVALATRVGRPPSAAARVAGGARPDPARSSLA
jgi:heme A synthase